MSSAPPLPTRGHESTAEPPVPPALDSNVVIWPTPGGTTTPSCEHVRARVARELHDDIAQRIGALSAELGLLRERLVDAPADVRENVDSALSETASIGADVQRIARGLHPPRLEQQGLDAAIRQHCEALARAHQLAVDVQSDDLPLSIDRGAALCIYRIVQEALHNVVKHSGADRADVTLTATPQAIVVRIADRGVGFETRRTRLDDTLGLIGMYERAQMARAELRVSSSPGTGTIVEAHVPMRVTLAGTS